jgi:serine/threonine protein kinase
MRAPRQCVECGSDLSLTGISEGLCPECLLGAGVEEGAAVPQPATTAPAWLETMPAGAGGLLASGTHLGPYQILSPLDAGGMGEVYRARDNRLGRNVAIKVLRAPVARDPASRQYFEAEARTLARLSHPHICALYDVGDHGGLGFLVMEYLEGQTLAERLAAGPLPPADALRYAIEIADALAWAHRHSLIHRDIKPSNIMLTRSGAKLLDFGLARLLESDASGSAASLLTSDRASGGERTIIGTVEYMAPEQLEGGETDARTDIFAFGLLVYEMLSGQTPFRADSAVNLAVAVRSAEVPPLSVIRPQTPLALERLITRCLAKDPEERWQSARDLLVELQWIAEDALRAETLKSAAVHRRRMRLVGVAAAILGVILVDRLINHSGEEDAGGAGVVRRLVSPPSPPGALGANSLAFVSPDGRQVAWVVSDGDSRSLLWTQPLDSVSAMPLDGTEGARFPFWSPDSRHIAFFANQQLKRVEATGGPVAVVADAPSGHGGSWNRDGTILFAPESTAALYRVPMAGGVPVAVTAIDSPRGETAHHWPSFLPDGRRFVYCAYRSSVQSCDVYQGVLGSPERTWIASADSAVTYAAPGFLLFVREGKLLALPFDAGAGRTLGDAVLVERAVHCHPDTGPSFSVSNNQVLVFHRVVTPGRHWFVFGRHQDEPTRTAGVTANVLLNWPRSSPK